MSRLEDSSVEFRKEALAKNSYGKTKEYNPGHKNALSDGDEKGRGETNTIGTKTDISERVKSEAKNKFTKTNPYSDSNA